MLFIFLLSISPILLTNGQIVFGGVYTVSSSPVVGSISLTRQYQTRWLTKTTTTTTTTNSIIATFTSVSDSCPVGQYPSATVALVNNDYFESTEYTTITDRGTSSSINCLQTGGNDLSFSWANLKFCTRYNMARSTSTGLYSITIEMRPTAQVNINGNVWAGSTYYMGAEITINCSTLTPSPTTSPTPRTSLSSTPWTSVLTYTRSTTIASTFIYSTTRFATRWLTDGGSSITAGFTLNNRCPSPQTLTVTVFVVDNDYSSSNEYTTVRINTFTPVLCLQYGGSDRSFSWGNAKSCKRQTLISNFGSTYILTVTFSPTSSVGFYPTTYNGLPYDMGAAIVIHCSGTTVNVINSGIASSTPTPTINYSSATATAAAVAAWIIILSVCGSICFVCCVGGLIFYLCCAAAAAGASSSRPANKVTAAPVVMAVSTTTTTTQSGMVTQGQPMTQPGIQQPYQPTPQYNTGVPGPQGGNSEYAAVQQTAQYVNQPLYAPGPAAGAPGDQMMTQPGGATAPGYVPYAPAGNAPPQYNGAMMNQAMDAPPGYDVSVGAPPAYGGAPPAYGGGPPSYGQAPPVYGQGEGGAATGNASRGY